MDLMRAETKAVSEMRKHGLLEKGWTFAFDRATSRLGQCDYGKKRITISKHFTGAATPEQFEQTLIHEMAHALLPVGVHHGWQWKAKARELGYMGKRTSHNPFHEQQRQNSPVFATRPVAGTDNPVVPKVLVTAMKGSTATLNIGDKLVLPTGATLTVQEVNSRQTKAVEVGTGAVWNLSTADAHHFLKV